MIFVTGATGFVGSRVARLLVAKGHKVKVLARPSSNMANLKDLPVEVVRGDLLDVEALRSALTGCEGLYHVAADYRLWVPNPDDMFKANIEASRNLFRLAASVGVKRMVYTSSVAALGLVKNGVADEATPSLLEDKVGPYKQSKFLAEQAVLDLCGAESLPIVIVNPSMPVGPGDIKPTPTGRMIIEATSGRMPAFVDTGLNVVHVDDVAKGHLLAYETGVVGEKYILGGENLSLKQLLGLIAHIQGRAAPRIKLPRQSLYPLAICAEWAARLSSREPMLTVNSLRMAAKYMYYKSDKAKDKLGYQARPVTEALRDAIAYFKAIGMVA